MGEVNEQIKIYTAEAWGDYRSFYFSHDESKLPEYSGKCKCGLIKLSSDYLIIISKLKKAGLLDKDYETLCCDCFYKMKKVKRIFCECGRLLKLLIGDKYVEIHCEGCGHVYLEEGF